MTNVVPLQRGEYKPPRLLDCEQALLGMTLGDPSHFKDGLPLDAFTEPGHRTIWRAISEALESGVGGEELLPILSTRLAFWQDVADLGGATYLADLYDKAPMAADSAQLAEELHWCWHGRQQKRLADGLGNLDDEAVEWLDHQASKIMATWSGDAAELVRPFVWKDMATIPPREWLYGNHYIRQFITTTVAPGGLGKSSLVIAEALAMASGKPVLGVQPTGRFKVAYWNGEDPQEEIERRVLAGAHHYGLGLKDVEEWLFLGSGRDRELTIAEQTRDGVTVHKPVVQSVKALIQRWGLDVLIVDPFVASHRVTENDNNAIERVAKTWAKIADETRTSIELVHHVRKGAGPSHEHTVEDGRGAVALLAAVRSARVLNGMTEDEAERAGVERRRSYFRVDNGKANLAPPPDGSDWYRFVSVSLGNGGLEGGDQVGVPEPWRWPDPFADVSAGDLLNVQRKVASGTWRESPQSPEWVGKAVADVLGMDSDNKSDASKLKLMIRRWLQSGALKVDERLDEKRRPRKFVEVGSWADE